MILYEVFSKMPDCHSSGTVDVHWANIYNERDDCQYGEIIQGYNDMTPLDKCFPKMCIEMLFTSDEVKALRHFLNENLRCDLEVFKIIDLSLPLKEQEYAIHGGLFDTFVEIPIYEMDNYNLPFDVKGYFDPTKGDPIIEGWADAYDFMGIVYPN